MFCKKCGAQIEDGNAKFCTKCGAPLNGEQTVARTESVQKPKGSKYGIMPRNIALCVVFSIITCGIYAIYWMIKLNDEVNQIVGEREATTGGMVFLFSLITCGIYSFYWNYKMGERCDTIKGNTNGSSNILYLILSIFGWAIINYCLMQDTINKSLSEY